MKNFLATFLVLSFALCAQAAGGEGSDAAKQPSKPSVRTENSAASNSAASAKSSAAKGASPKSATEKSAPQSKDASAFAGAKFFDPAGLKYIPHPDLKGKQTGELELRFSYDVRKTGKRDPETGIALNDVYERIYTADGETLFYELKIGYTKPPLSRPLKQVIKFIKSGEERWIEMDFYNMNGVLESRTQHCLWDEINVEAKVAFDKGEVASLYKGSYKFDGVRGIFSDQNFFSYIGDKAHQKRYITVRAGLREEYYENFTDKGEIADTSYLRDTRFIWLKRFYPNGALKSFSHYDDGFERIYDERGKLVKEEKIKIYGR